VHTDGSILAYTNSSVEAYTNGPVQVHPAANDGPQPKVAPQVGDRMIDGTVYAGISPDTGKAMYVTPADAVTPQWPGHDKLTYTFNQAQKYAAKLDAHGHQDWRVPTKGELNVLFQNRSAIGGFNASSSVPASWYWSSSQFLNILAWAQRFSDGLQNYDLKRAGGSLRCVR
jgi:hypothetical protein